MSRYQRLKNWFRNLRISDDLDEFFEFDESPQPESPQPESPQPESPQPESPQPESKFKIESWDDLLRVRTIAAGGDPNAAQMISKFMDVNSLTQGSNFPNILTATAVGQLNAFGEIFYKGSSSNGYTLLASKLSEGYMGLKGFKSNQVVDITRQVPNLSNLETVQQEAQKGFFSRILNRKPSE